MKKFFNVLAFVLLIYCSCISVNAQISQDDQSMIISGFETLSNDTIINKDVYVLEDATFMSSSNLTINGNLYVFGSMQVSKHLIINGVANVLNYAVFEPTMYSDNVEVYDYGKLTAFGTASIQVLNVSDDYLNITIPEITVPTVPDSSGNTENSGNKSPTSTPTTNDTCATAILISESKLINNETISKNVYIAKDAVVMTDGDCTIKGNLYVKGTLSVYGNLTVTGDIHCLSFSSDTTLLSAGDYNYGQILNFGHIKSNLLSVNGEFLSYTDPEIHKNTFWQVQTPATCTETGKSICKCQVCGALIEEKTLPATGHSFGPYSVISNATYECDGLKERSCNICHTKERATIPKIQLPHTEPQVQDKPDHSDIQKPIIVVDGDVDTIDDNLYDKKAILKLNVKSIPLQVNKTFSGIKVEKILKGDKIIKWKSSNSKIVSVSKKGKLVAKKIGKANITCYTKKGASASFRVTVQKKAVALKKISVNKKAVTLRLKKGKNTFQIVASKYPLTSSGSLKYSSSNKKVATVNTKGKITGKKEGTAKIYIKCGKKTATVKVNVKKK